MLLDPVQTAALYRFAVERRFAILAVNADSHAALIDCLEAAQQCRAALIIETSLWQLNGRGFGGGDPILGLARYLADLAVLASAERYRDVPLVFHTDHIKGADTCRILAAAIRGLPVRHEGAEFRPRASSISLDSSELSEAENIAHARFLCQLAKEADLPLCLEMEAGVDDGVTPIELADRLLAPVESSHPGCLALWAPGVGTQHGLAEEGHAFSPEAVLRHRERASEICGRPIGLALHGSSGLPSEALEAGVRAGVAKVNWSSESLLIRGQATRDYVMGHQAEWEKEHPQWKATVMDNGLQSHIAKCYVPRVIERIRTLGGEGQGAKFLAERLIKH